MPKEQERKIVISLWSAGSCGRKQLAGILRFANSGRAWNARIMMDPADFNAQAIRQAEAEGVDGFIAFVSQPTAAAALARTRIPTVLLSYPTPELFARTENLVRIVNDNATIGRLAADHFLSLGRFAEYGFVPDAQDRGWSREREQAFAARLARHGYACNTFDGHTQSLADWLQALRKPAALFAPFDFRAREVLQRCLDCHLRVPDQVAILGVDDDDLICENARPTLSSIRLDQETIGYRAAEALARLMSRRAPTPSRTLVMPAGRVVARASTRPTPPAAALVERMLAFIDAHAAEPIDVARVVEHANVSRRLAELRFRTATGESLRRAIEDRHLALLKRRLADTSLSIAQATVLSGFDNVMWAKYVFKRRVGVTMSHYRAALHEKGNAT